MGDNFGGVLTVWGVGIIMLVMIVSMNLESLTGWINTKIVEIEQIPGLIICIGIMLSYVFIILVPPAKKLIITPLEQIQKGTEQILKNFFS